MAFMLGCMDRYKQYLTLMLRFVVTRIIVSTSFTKAWRKTSNQKNYAIHFI